MELHSPEHHSNAAPKVIPEAPLPGETPSSQAGYVLAERDKRARALWADTPTAKEARSYLKDTCLLCDATIAQYHFGLVHREVGEAKESSNQELCVPVPDKRGPDFAPCLAAENPTAKRRGQYVFLAVPGAQAQTQAAQGKRGPTLTMYVTPEGRDDLVVCSSVLDAICLAQMLAQSSAGRFTVIASTHTNEFPADWYHSNFWAHWQRVYFAPNGDPPSAAVPISAAQDVRFRQLANVARRPVLRVELPETAQKTALIDWLSYFRSGGTPQTVLQLFDDAQPFARSLSIPEGLSCVEPPRLSEFAEGEYGDVTYDVAYNFVGGYYYYPFSVLQFSLGAKGQKQITRLTRLLRNDGRILGWARVPSSSGTSDVVAADDGTILSRPPEVSECATWSLDHILAYARGTKTGGSYGRRLADILRDMGRLFEQCIWLPQPEHLYVLLFTVPVTYVQELFSAVPYLLIQGPKGSGKSELAHLLSWVSSNSTIIGAGSHAFTAAQIDQARGLIVLDDRETLAADDLDKDLLELLKVGYKRSTGIRGIIGQNRKIIRQHVYGVKAITCVSGVEEIVGTRMLRIRTAPYSKARAINPIRRFQAADQEIAQKLRQELHAWAFGNVSLIRSEYDKLAQSDSRWDEITAPLRVFAALCGDTELQSKLENALRSQAQQETADVPIEVILSKTVEDLVTRGLTREISVTHISNELACRLSSSPTLSLDSPQVTSSWITRLLKAQGWLKSGTAVRRARVRKKALQRIWELEPGRVTGIIQKLNARPESLDALAFCQACEACEYKPICKIKKYFEPRGTT